MSSPRSIAPSSSTLAAEPRLRGRGEDFGLHEREAEPDAQRPGPRPARLRERVLRLERGRARVHRGAACSWPQRTEVVRGQAQEPVRRRDDVPVDQQHDSRTPAASARKHELRALVLERARALVEEHEARLRDRAVVADPRRQGVRDQLVDRRRALRADHPGVRGYDRHLHPRMLTARRVRKPRGSRPPATKSLTTRCHPREGARAHHSSAGTR
jgi:hypothetical protein